MKINLHNILFYVLFLTGAVFFYSCSSNVCDKFLDSRSISDYEKCELFLSNGLEANNYITSLYSEGDIGFKRLIGGIYATDESVIELSFVIRQYAEGAMLEDVNIAIGNIIAKKSEFILNLFLKYELDDYSLKSILLSTDEGLVDNFQGQVSELKMRYVAIDRLNSINLANLTKRCKEILMLEIAALEIDVQSLKATE